ncbi:unnamed protein product [Blepharisma stoltei]|uniref:Uncharacterized protein n=1 Tax=Blepharisma stoltei TaxID=1481888 RepID=A0AAU9JYJ3_9CILI|nr:unnamed protein product [Blepharisma stoltei]
MQNNFPAPLGEMVNFRIDTSKLQSNLDYLHNSIASTKKDIDNANTHFQSDLAGIHSEIDELKKLEPKVASFSDHINESENLKRKIDAWDDRFKSLDEKIFNVQYEANANLKELSNTIEITINSTKNDLENTINDIRQDFEECFSKQLGLIEKTNSEKFERLENILNYELKRRCTLKKVKKLIKTELLKNPQTVQSSIMNNKENEEDGKKEEKDEDSMDDYNLNEIFLRLNNLEKRMSTERQQVAVFSQKAEEILQTDSVPDKSELLNEFQLKFIRIVGEINQLKEILNTIPNKPAEPTPELTVSTEGFNSFEILDKKILSMENSYSRTIENLKNQIESMKYTSGADKRKQSISVKSIHDLNNLEQNISAHIESTTEQVYKEINFIKSEISTIQNNLTLKVFRAELEEIIEKLNKQKSRSAQKVETPKNNENVGFDFKSLETRVNSMWISLEKVHKMEEAFQKVINENIDVKIHKFDEKLDSQYRELTEKMQELQRFCVAETGDKGDRIDIFIEKVQMIEEEIRMVKAHRRPTVQLQPIESQNIANAKQEEEEEESDRSLDSSFQYKTLTSQLKVQDAYIKQANSNIQKLTLDVKRIQEIIDKNQEDGLNAYLNQLEELKANLSEVMTKVQEGSRLNQRDFSMLTDLYHIVEGKGNKDEILEKVDRRELKQAYWNLSKKIDSVQGELKTIEESKRRVVAKIDKPTLFKQKDNNECLACGQNIPAPSYSAREWTNSGSFPALTHSRFGPGFSKILPMVHASSEAFINLHLKSKSELPFPVIKPIEKSIDNSFKALSSTRSNKTSSRTARVSTTIGKDR